MCFPPKRREERENIIQSTKKCRELPKTPTHLRQGIFKIWQQDRQRECWEITVIMAKGREESVLGSRMGALHAPAPVKSRQLNFFYPGSSRLNYPAAAEILWVRARVKNITDSIFGNYRNPTISEPSAARFRTV